MGRVYEGIDKQTNSRIALKVLHEDVSRDDISLERFKREYEISANLPHDYIVSVTDFHRDQDAEVWLLVMEYLDGMSLQSALGAAGGAMPLPRALHIALQLCEAAGEAHAQGIVHRDLKPDNVMLVLRADDPDYVKVLDFGIARLDWDAPSSATAAA